MLPTNDTTEHLAHTLSLRMQIASPKYQILSIAIELIISSLRQHGGTSPADDLTPGANKYVH